MSGLTFCTLAMFLNSKLFNPWSPQCTISYESQYDCSFTTALCWCSQSYFVNQADILLELINKFGYIRNTRSLLISLNMNIVKVNLSNNGLSLTNITKYDISFQKHPMTTNLRIINGKVAKCSSMFSFSFSVSSRANTKTIKSVYYTSDPSHVHSILEWQRSIAQISTVGNKCSAP